MYIHHNLICENGCHNLCVRRWKISKYGYDIIQLYTVLIKMTQSKLRWTGHWCDIGTQYYSPIMIVTSSSRICCRVIFSWGFSRKMLVSVFVFCPKSLSSAFTPFSLPELCNSMIFFLIISSVNSLMIFWLRSCFRLTEENWNSVLLKYHGCVILYSQA